MSYLDEPFEAETEYLLNKKIDELKKSLAFASGLISGIPGYTNKHPMEIMEHLIQYGQNCEDQYFKDQP